MSRTVEDFGTVSVYGETRGENNEIHGARWDCRICGADDINTQGPSAESAMDLAEVALRKHQADDHS